MTKLKGKLGGFKKGEVDEHIRQMQQTQKAELEELTKKIESCQKEKEVLGQELSTLTDQNIDFTSVILLELALNKVERVTEYINQTAKEDVLAIQESARQKLLALEEAIIALENDILEAKENIKNELKNIIEIANGEEGKKTTSLSDEESLDNKNNGKVYPIADWLKNNKSEQSNKESEFWGELLENQPQESVKPMTADGTTEVPLSKSDKLGNNVADTNIKQPDQDSDSIANKSSHDLSKKNEVGQADFWGDDPVWEEESDRSNEEIAVTEDRSEPSPSQAGVRQEIDTVRHKYVLGKIAGEDLLDDSGGVIIRKNDKITESVVETAQKEGKLADLIIHMILPGQEE